MITTGVSEALTIGNNTVIETPLVVNGNLKVSGPIVFPDDSTQATATLEGPQGIQGIQGLQGPKGDKGEPGAPGVCTCNPGDMLNCYTGPMATLDVGSCSAGVRVCGPGGAYSACIGEVVPTTEICLDGIDNDCNGETDEGCAGFCNTAQDCQVYAQPPTCTDQAMCQGHRLDSTCVNNQCGNAVAADDSGCAGLVSATCGLYADVVCTASLTQPPGQNALCAVSCSNDGDCDLTAHCDISLNTCVAD